jgi:hypothetical protein
MSDNREAVTVYGGTHYVLLMQPTGRERYSVALRASTEGRHGPYAEVDGIRNVSEDIAAFEFENIYQTLPQRTEPRSLPE